MVRDILSRMAEAFEEAHGLSGLKHHESFMAMEKAVLHAGRDMPGRALPSNYLRGMPKACFQNSRRLARKRVKLVYVEGFFVRPDIGFPIHHGWCVDHTGAVIDVTLDRPEDCSYIGVAFTPEEVKRWATPMSSSLFDTGCGVNIELIRKLMARQKLELGQDCP